MRLSNQSIINCKFACTLFQSLYKDSEYMGCSLINCSDDCSFSCIFNDTNKITSSRMFQFFSDIYKRDRNEIS